MHGNVSERRTAKKPSRQSQPWRTAKTNKSARQRSYDSKDHKRRTAKK
jgi:hypothetical protein